MNARDENRKLIDEAATRLHAKRVELWEAHDHYSLTRPQPYPKRPTIRDLAALIGVSSTTLYRYRMGRTMPARVAQLLTSLARTEAPANDQQ